jgi:hypothetical protein
VTTIFRRLLPLVVCALALCGCAYECGACVGAFSVTVTLPGGGGGPVSVDGLSTTPSCSEIPDGRYSCYLDTLPVGDHTATVSAPGYEPRVLSFTLTGAGGGSCSCPASYRDDIALARMAGADAGVPDGG